MTKDKAKLIFTALCNLCALEKGIAPVRQPYVNLLYSGTPLCLFIRGLKKQTDCWIQNQTTCLVWHRFHQSLSNLLWLTDMTSYHDINHVRQWYSQPS